MVNFEQDVKRCVEVLNNGGAILYPTDTVWGLGCDATNEEAVENVFNIKHRPKNKSLIVLLAEAKDILQYVAAPHPDIIEIIESFEQPTTVVYEGALGFADNVVHEDGSIAIRITQDPFCKALIKRFQKPIVSTSANISGEPAPAFFNEVDALVKEGVDYIVEYRQNDNIPRRPSRLIKINDDGTIEILRP